MAPKRKADVVDPEANVVGTSQPSAEYPVLQPHTKHVTQRAITSRWTTLSISSQDNARELFTSVERQVTLKHESAKRRQEAETALAPVMRILRRKLPRMAFPPTSRETHFDAEALLDNTRALEAQLTSVTHSIMLRKAEVEKEEKLLEWDRARLAALQRDASNEESLIRRQNKRIHPLLRGPSAGVGPPSELGAAAGIFAQSHDDDALRPIVQQLHHHLDSLKSNTSSMEGIATAIRRTHAAIDDALYQKDIDGRGG